MAAPHRIDVHHHFVPPAYRDEMNKKRPMQPCMQSWSIQNSLDDMDQAETQIALVSITTPGLYFGHVEEARRLARLCNDYGMAMIRDHPGRFGLFAALPWPDVEGSLKEAEYALDTLKADGICLFTSYGDKWLGHADFNPLFEELNRRKAVVYVHPHAAACCMSLIPEVNESIIEYGTDTSRTIASLVFTGASHRYPDIQWIFSHAGGTMPFLIERMVNLAKLPQVAAKLPNGLMHELKRFYYDTAQAANISALGCLKSVVGTGQIVFGTDYPYRTSIEHVEGVAGTGFTKDEIAGIDRRNALRLLPRLGMLATA
ncbi:MAG TPA: amidohydrolase family protein [Stellaceae bacterium]|nr:amidohydrolase family protein [Stellaceae bacterium]